MILSVSRRTDIPAFYGDWFFKQLDQGFVLVPNPIAHEKIAKIALKPLIIENMKQIYLAKRKLKHLEILKALFFGQKTQNLCLIKWKN